MTVGDVTLDPAAANRLTYGPDTEFTVNFTNGGEHDEFDIQVTLKIEGGPEPLQVRKTVPTVAAGAAATATLGLPSDPPFGTPVTISIQIQPGARRGEEGQQQRGVRRLLLAGVGARWTS